MLHDTSSQKNAKSKNVIFYVKTNDRIINMSYILLDNSQNTFDSIARSGELFRGACVGSKPLPEDKTNINEHQILI